MTRFYFAAFMAVLVALCAGCNGQQAGSEARAADAGDTHPGLHQEQEWRGITLAVDYTPKAAVVRDMLGDKYSTHRGDSLAATLSDYVYFRFTLSRNGGAVTNGYAANPEHFANAQAYLSGMIGRNIRLLVGEKSYDAYDFLYVQGNGMSRGSTVVVVFRNVPDVTAHDFQFVYDDRFFGTGTSVFDFKGESIASLKRQ